MPKLLQINVTSNWGSTGKIAEAIGIAAEKNGWKCYTAYGRYQNPSSLQTIKVGSMRDVYLHYAADRLLDMEGLASVRATKNLISQIIDINPDVIQLHNIHDHYLNYPLLFEYLNSTDIPVVWTQHDCWAYTGGCGYYSMAHCDKWKAGCEACPLRKGFRIDRRAEQFKKRNELLNSSSNLTIVPVSEWLSKEIAKSFLRRHPIHPILNGIDTGVFKLTEKNDIREKYNLGDGHFFLGVASVWSRRKGLCDYIKLSSLLSHDEKIVLVGLSEKQRRNLPANIIGIPRTQNVGELVALYNEASIVLNLSYEETFGLTTVEGFACGAPGIVYNCTASPELITPETGRVVEPGDINCVYDAIKNLLSIGKNSMTEACRKRAEEKYDKEKKYREYIELYNSLIHSQIGGV